MINLKKENKNLKKRINFLENLLKNSLSKKSLEDYITNDLLIECNEKEKILYNLIPDKNLEVLYQVGELTFKRRKHYKKNNNNQEKKNPHITKYFYFYKEGKKNFALAIV